MKQILGQKINMTRIYDQEGKVIPITLIEVKPNYITQIKEDNFQDQTVQVGYGQKKHLTKPLLGHLKGNKFQFIKEIKINQTKKLTFGDEVKVDLFSQGDKVKVTGFSKGKGFAGVVRRHKFSRGPETHGSDHHRAPGSIGSMFPQRVIRGKKMPGHLGHQKKSILNLEVIEVNPEKNYLMVKGAVPGAKKNLLLITKMEGKK